MTKIIVVHFHAAHAFLSLPPPILDIIDNFCLLSLFQNEIKACLKKTDFCFKSFHLALLALFIVSFV